MTNDLVLIAEQNGLQKSEVENIMASFGGFFEEAKKIATESDITVTDESQTDLMKSAREKRLALKEIRVNAEKVRKELKEKSLREGKAIDGAANIIKALIVPVEEHLEKQEKFAEIREAERQAKKHAYRIEELSKYVDDVSLYTLNTMSDEAFEKLLQSSKTAWEVDEFNKKRAEEERLKKEEADRLEQIKIKEENERLKKEAEAAEKKREEERAVEQSKLQKEKEERDRLAAIEKKKQDDALAAERKAKEEAENKLKVERELQEKKELEEKQRIENNMRLQEEEKRKALLAPDKEKLLDFANRIEMILAPHVMSRQGGSILGNTLARLQLAADELREECKKL